MATAGAQYIIPRYSSRAGTFGQKLISGGTGRGEEGLAGRSSSSPYQSLRTVAFKCWPYSFHPSLRWNDLGSIPGDFHVHTRKTAGDRERERERDAPEDRECVHQCECVLVSGCTLITYEYVSYAFVGFVAQQIQSKTDSVFV